MITHTANFNRSPQNISILLRLNSSPPFYYLPPSYKPKFHLRSSISESPIVNLPGSNFRRDEPRFRIQFSGRVSDLHACHDSAAIAIAITAKNQVEDHGRRERKWNGASPEIDEEWRTWYSFPTVSAPLSNNPFVPRLYGRCRRIKQGRANGRKKRWIWGGWNGALSREFADETSGF